jgi:hypothetical protein
LLEGVDAKVHLIYHTDSIEAARSAGKLAVNSFIRLRKTFADRLPEIEVSDYGDAAMLLGNQTFFKKQAQFFLRRGITEEQNNWGGWLGQYFATLRSEIETERLAGRNRTSR